MTKEEIQNKIASLKSKLSNPKLSEYYDDFNKGIAKLENDLAMVGETAVKDVKKVEKKVAKAVTSVRKPRTTKASTSNDIEKAKAEIKAKTGKTESECEDIIEKYRALRTKSQERRKKEVSANESNTKRIVKLKKQGDIIEGTNIKTADATIESAKVDVVDKIEKQIEVAEEKAEVEATKEVAKDKTLTPTEKKKAVAEKVEKVVKEKTKVIVKRVIIDTTAFLTSISDKLGEFDKDSQKEFLIKLRSDIDKLLSKYSYGGITSGATQGYNITQSNMSSSSVNSFANGGGVDSNGKPIPKYILEFWKNFAEGDENTKIRSWYMKAFPQDNRGKYLDLYNTFEDLWNAIHNNQNVYHIMGEGDSLIRERLFDKLSQIKGVKYDYIYDKWLESDDDAFAKGGGVNGKDLEAIKNKYLENEDINNHSENVVLLAKYFGSAEDLKQAERILSIHDEEGHLYGENSLNRRKLSQKLIDKARKEMAKKGIEFAHGGMTEHGLRVGDRIIEDFPNDSKYKNNIDVIDKKGEVHSINLDKGERFGDGGSVAKKYKVVKVFRKSGRKEILEKNLTLEEAKRVVERYPNSNTSMVIFTEMLSHGGGLESMMRSRRGM